MTKHWPSIYFAGSISAGRNDAETYEKILSHLLAHGSVLTEHVADANLTEAGEQISDKRIHDRDLDWLSSADCVVAEVTQPSLGVGYEIAKAEEWGKPILCLYQNPGRNPLSAMISGAVGVKCVPYEKIEEAEAAIEEFLTALEQ